MNLVGLGNNTLERVVGLIAVGRNLLQEALLLFIFGTELSGDSSLTLLLCQSLSLGSLAGKFKGVSVFLLVLSALGMCSIGRLSYRVMN